jgi:hypothetical protein
LRNKGRRHPLLSKSIRAAPNIVVLGASAFLIVFLVLLFVNYPNLSLNTNINGTLFAGLLAGVFSTAGIIFKAFHDLLDSEKKKNERLLEGTLNDVEKYYYPIALAAQAAALYLKETIGRSLELKTASYELVREDSTQAELAEDIASQLNGLLAMNKYRIAYSLFLIGRFYFHKHRLELDKGGDIILRNRSREPFLRNLYDRMNELMFWTGEAETKDESIYIRSVLLTAFLKTSDGKPRDSPYTFSDFVLELGLPDMEKNTNLNQVFGHFKKWLKKNPKQVLRSSELLLNYGIWIESYVRELSTFWYRDNPKEVEFDEMKQKQHEEEFNREIEKKLSKP